MILAAGDEVSNAKEGAMETFLLSIEENLSISFYDEHSLWNAQPDQVKHSH